MARAGRAAITDGASVAQLLLHRRSLERFHGIDPATASERLHAIKKAVGFGPRDNVVFDLTGNVYDEFGSWIGSLTEGGAKVPK